MKTHKITNGILRGYEFNGTEMIINKQKVVWDNDSIGRSYPWINVHRFRSTQHLLSYKHE